MGIEVIIRPMEIKDIQEVSEIENEIFSIPWSKKSFEESCVSENNIYLVAQTDKGIAGYCGLWTVLGEGNITNMAVSHKYRKLGIGTLLMKSLEKYGRKKNVDIFFLEVRESNDAARHLYDNMGYKEIGRRKRFYEKPVEDAIVMSKTYEKEFNI